MFSTERGEEKEGEIFDNVTFSLPSSSTSGKITSKNNFNIKVLANYGWGSTGVTEAKNVAANSSISVTTWITPDILAVMKRE